MNWEMTLQVERNKGRDEGRAEGKAEGKSEGVTLNQIDLVQKKVRKEKTLMEIIEDLESDETTIRPIYEAVISAPAFSTPEQILEIFTAE